MLLRYNEGKDIREELFEEPNTCYENFEEIIQAAVRGTIAGITTTIIIDTGANMNVMSEDFYKRIRDRVKVPSLPVQNCVVSGAIGARTQRVDKQILIDVEFDEGRMECMFLVVKGLAVPCLLGMEFLRRGCAIVDLRQGKCCVEKEGGTLVLSLLRTKGRQGKLCRGVSIKVSCAKLWYCNNQDQWTDCHSDTVSINMEEEFPTVDEVLEKAKESKSLNDEQKQELADLLLEYTDVFSTKPGVIQGYVYKMEVVPHSTFCCHTYSVPWSKREEVKREIRKMLSWGIIETSLSPYASPLLAVGKAGGGVRLVLDARMINKIIVPVRTRPEPLEEQLQRFHNAKYLTTIDVRASFWQVALHEESRKYTAFIFAGRSYQFKVLPFGLNISSGVFITALDTVLGAQLIDKIALYVDDILVATPTWEEHIYLLRTILEKFKVAGVTANLAKSRFAKEQIKFLGHMISPAGILPDPDKIRAIQNFPPPNTKKQLKAYLGLVSFFRKFVPKQLLNSNELLKLLRKNATWFWSRECQEVFDNIKHALVNSNILSHPDMSKDFFIASDASRYGLGGFLFQTVRNEGRLEVKAISFASRVLSESERSYSTTELEALAVIWSFKKFHYYVYGKHVKVLCDHKALSFLLSCKLMHQRLSRWCMILQEYDFEIIYIKGKDNIVADALSRMPEGLPEFSELLEQVTNCPVLLMKNNAHKNYYLEMCRNMSQLQDNDERWGKIKQTLKQEPDHSLSQLFKIYQNVLFHRNDANSQNWRVCIPSQSVNHLIWYTHMSWGHFGVEKCTRKIGNYCYVPNLRRRVYQLLRTCITCQKTKPNNSSNKLPLHPILTKRPRQIVAIDVAGPYPQGRGGSKYLVAVHDLFTKHVKLYVTKSTRATPIIKRLTQEYFPKYGKPAALLSDNAANFTGNAWTSFLKRNNIKQILISRFHPESNPTERIFREFNRFIRTYVPNKQTQWIDFVTPFEQIVNDLPHISTGFTPNELMLNRREANEWVKPLPRITGTDISHEEKIRQAIVALNASAQHRKTWHDKNVKKVQTFSVGELILLRTHPKPSLLKKQNKKWQLLYTGPYEIIKIPHEGCFLLAYPHSGKIKGLYHHRDLKKYIR